MTVINVVLSGNSVQTVDAFVPALAPFLQMRAGSHELIAGTIKFDACFPQPFLNVQPQTSFGGSFSPRSPRSPLGLFPLLHAESYSKRRRDFCLAPNLPNQPRVSTVPRPRVLCLCLCLCFCLCLCLYPKNQFPLIFLR